MCVSTFSVSVFGCVMVHLDIQVAFRGRVSSLQSEGCEIISQLVGLTQPIIHPGSIKLVPLVGKSTVVVLWILIPTIGTWKFKPLAQDCNQEMSSTSMLCVCIYIYISRKEPQ